MTGKEEVLANLSSIFRDVLDDDDLQLTDVTTAQDVDNWDSLNHVRLMITVQQRFGIKFSASEIGKLKNVGDLVTLIQERVK